MKKSTDDAVPGGAATAPVPPAVPPGVMTAAEVLAELSDIASARLDGEDGLPVKMADKLKALEMLRKYHEQTADRSAAGTEGLTIRVEGYGDGADG